MRRLALLPLIFLCSLLPAQEDPAALDAVKMFKTYFRKMKTAEERVEAVRTLKGNESSLAAMELVQLLDHKEELIRRAAMDVVSTFKKRETFRTFIAELPELKETTRQALLIEVLGRAGIKWALPVILQVGGDPKKEDPLLRIKVAGAISRLAEAKAELPLLATYMQDKDTQVRIAACAAAATVRAAKVDAALVACLQDKAWQVQSAAIKAASAIRVEKAIDPLIEMMGGGGRFMVDCAEALFAITGFDMGVDVDSWRSVIKRRREIGWRMPTDEEMAKKRAARQRSDEYYGKKSGKKTTFAKITTTSTKVLFIIDVSGSMEDHITEKEKFRDGGYDDYSKLTIVKTELANTIEGLDANTRFNIVAFASDLKVWKPRLVPANVISKRAAQSFIKRLKPLGGKEAAAAASVGLSSDLSQGKTNTFKALMYAFGIDPEKEIKTVFTKGSSRKLLKRELDTVFFLSDGKPSTGKYVDINDIVEEVTKINKVYQMTLHTIAIGSFDKNFLRALAMQNGGEFVDLGK